MTGTGFLPTMHPVTSCIPFLFNPVFLLERSHTTVWAIMGFYG